MIWLSGHTCPICREVASFRRDIGLMCQPGNSLDHWTTDYPAWAADNGCFSGAWRELSWLRWLVAIPAPDALFAVVPDVFCDPIGTNARWTHYAPKVRRLRYPLAYVAQDGLTPAHVPWAELDVLFVGGSTEWKESGAAAQLVGEAQAQGKRTHMGRVNTFRRLQIAHDWGCDTVDGTLLGFGCEKNLPILVRFLDRLSV